jgi:ankyrin repeat protein
MKASLRGVFLAAVLVPAVAAAGQDTANRVPTPELVDSVCRAYATFGVDSTIFQAIADGDLGAASAAAAQWKHNGQYGPFPGPILWATEFNNLEMVKALVSSGVTADETYDACRDYSWEEPVVYKALILNRVEIARFLVQNGAGARSGYLLMYAIAYGDAELFSFSLPRVQEVDEQPEGYHMTPLMNAAAAGRLDFVTALVSRGADVNASVSRWALWGERSILHLDPWMIDPLAAAVEGRHLEVVKFLLSRNAAPSVHALEAALSTGQADLAEDFLRRGVRPRGASLVAACRGQLPGIAARFLDQGVSPHSEDHEGKSAADVAFVVGNQQILKMLTDRGGKPAVESSSRTEGEITDDHVNMRDAPDVKLASVLRQLSRGDEVLVLKVTLQEEIINGLKAPWYRVGVPVGKGDYEEPIYQQGWVFGAFLDVRQLGK